MGFFLDVLNTFLPFSLSFGQALFTLFAGLLLCLFFGYKGLPLMAYAGLTLVLLVFLKAPLWLFALIFSIFLIFFIKDLRAFLVSKPIMQLVQGLIPRISPTERTALEAGALWIDKDLFSGNPNFQKLMSESYPQLSKQEQAFLEGPVEELCRLCDNFDILQKKRIPNEIWDFIKKEKFLGMIIPKKYGGLEFSALAHSAVIQKLNSRSTTLAVTVMVPNSLGPAELLMHYGTEQQKDYYLPQLADGKEMLPCFALTEPEAGSDASSIQSSGVVFKGDDGQICIRLNWDKRWITLAAISKVLGLAVRLKDPDHLLGDKEDIGITCVLVPSNAKGVVLDRRHDPIGVAFYNCPTQGHDVVIPVDNIIGGRKRAGQGWTMLMECLGVGRGISLPSLSMGSSKLVARVVSSHAVIRKQFGCSIGQFEGIQEVLAQIAGKTYLMDAMRTYTLGALDSGFKPHIITAIAKYHATELGRDIINDGMDIMAGMGISQGRRNLIAPIYISTPIGITVEGANILTRTLMIFGQGAMRAHPYVFEEIKALENNDLKAFDRAFWGHIGHVFENACRAKLLNLTRGWLSKPYGDFHTKRYFRKLAWTSATFAFMADIVMALFGGGLKKREMLTGRFADILSQMYMLTAVLRRYEAEGRKETDLPFVHYAAKYCLNQIQEAFEGIFSNIDIKGVGWLFKLHLSLWFKFNNMGEGKDDVLVRQAAKALLKGDAARDHLTEGIYLPQDHREQLNRLERAFKVILQLEAVEHKIKKAIRAKQLPKAKIRFVMDEALEKKIITAKEHKALKESVELRLDAIAVDSFTQEEYLNPHKA